jgi:hypothetical protein
LSFVCRVRLPKCQFRNQQAGERDNYFFHDASFLMSKSPELVWIEQEPLRVFATVQFHLVRSTTRPLRIRPPMEE